MHIAQLSRIRLQAAVACLWLTLALPPQSNAFDRPAPPVGLTLVSRTTEVPAHVALDDDDWRWLRSKGVLRIGVARPSFAPMEMIHADMHYEGVTADVLGAVGQVLQLEVQVLDYTDRVAALAALQRNEVDLVGSANTYELAGNDVQLTRPYMDDTPILYVRKAETRAMARHFTGMRIATAEDYLPQAQLAERYPGARFIKFSSREQALSALAFGNADLYLGDAISSNYLVNLSYFNYVRPYATLDLRTGGFSFAVRSDATRLRSLLDAALVLVREHHSAELLKRWSGGGAAVSSEKVELSAAEQRWISRNPVVRFVTSNDAAPFSYFDSSGRFCGISADVLRAISARTGLEFQPVRAARLEDQLKYLESGKADLTALIPTAQREGRLRFSRPIIHTPFAIITRSNDGTISEAAQLRGKRMALPEGHALRELLQPAHHYRFTDADGMASALDMVARGEADATAAFLPIAQYYISTLHEDRLKVANIVERTPAGLSFATRKDDAELSSIINKALLLIPPDEIDVFQNRWRPRADVSQGTWVDYRGLIVKLSVLAFMFILISLVWNLHIRSQYRRRQLAEAALGEQLNLMQSLINGTPHAIYVRDREARMITCNANYLEVFGATREAVVGKSALEGVKLDLSEAKQFHQDYLWVMENRKALEVDRTLHLPGRILSIYHWIHPYCDSQGQVKGVISGWIDVSERRQLMEDLREARDIANESSRAKTTFLATMSHEIRTPMSAVIGMLELALKHAEQGRFDKAAVEVAYDSARGLLELIGDILDVVRIESGHVSLSPQRANLRDLVESVMRVFDGLARQKVLTLRLQMDAAVDCDVLVDPLRFKQVLSNLVGNAIKFTDTGEVCITVQTRSLADQRLLLQLRVQDTGIGIAEEELATLFEPFAQANHGRTARGGTGLGLPICRSLCELMGGHITVASSKGKGTCATVEIPLNVLPAVAGAPPVREQAVAPAHPKMRVLVVDDQQANRVLLAEQLAFFGQTVHSAANGEEGLRVWREYPIDIVITDCNMPVMNGYDMARVIRREEEDTGIPPCAVIGFTANAQPEEKARCLAAGMDDCLFKPVGLKALSDVLANLAGMRVVHGPVGDAPGEIGFDAALHELTGGDPDMTRLLVDEAYRDYVNDRVELAALADGYDPVALGNLVHRIKGGARILQQQTIMAACSQVERLCLTTPEDRTAILADVALIERELGDLVRRLDVYRSRVLGSS
jgi:two-component system sensor histidine kinase EvgS